MGRGKGECEWMVKGLDAELEQEFLEDQIWEALERITEEYHIKKRPSNGGLKNWLDAYTKERLLKLAAENGFEVRRGWKKAKLVDVIYGRIMETAEVRLVLLGKEYLQQIQRMFAGDFSGEDDAEVDLAEELKFYTQAYPVAVRLGFLYPFAGEGYVTTGVPAESEKMVGRVLADYSQLEAKYASEIKKSKELEGLLFAGIHMYGVFPRGKIFDLWKGKRSKAQISIAEYEEIFEDIEFFVPLLAIKNGFYIIDGYFIASDVFEGAVAAGDFYYSRSENTTVNYYKPMRAEVLYYEKHSFNRQSVYYKRFRQLLRRQKVNVSFNVLMRFFETNIQLGRSLSDLLNEIKNQRLLTFNSEADLFKFAELYTDVHNHTRLWELAGNTPHEMFVEMQELGLLEDQGQEQVGPELERGDKSVSMGELSMGELSMGERNGRGISKPNVSRKIKNVVGRNDPCPCGSGKKYKKCCLRKG